MTHMRDHRRLERVFCQACSVLGTSYLPLSSWSRKDALQCPTVVGQDLRGLVSGNRVLWIGAGSYVASVHQGLEESRVLSAAIADQHSGQLVNNGNSVLNRASYQCQWLSYHHTKESFQLITEGRKDTSPTVVASSTKLDVGCIFSGVQGTSVFHVNGTKLSL